MQVGIPFNQDFALCTTLGQLEALTKTPLSTKYGYRLMMTLPASSLLRSKGMRLLFELHAQITPNYGASLLNSKWYKVFLPQVILIFLEPSILPSMFSHWFSFIKFLYDISEIRCCTLCWISGPVPLQNIDLFNGTLSW